MKALVYTGPHELTYRDAPDPQPAPDEAVVAIKAVGICGSDMHAWAGHDERRPAPLILGHEAAGVTADGRRVTINPLMNCRECRACRSGRENLCPNRQILSMPPREGCFAEQVTVSERNLVEIPEGVSFEKASLAEPLACGWHAVRLAGETSSEPLETACCVVYGGGAIGYGAALALRAQGAADITIIEANPLRRDFLRDCDNFPVLTPENAPEPGSVDIIIDGVGIAPTRAAACAAIRPGGVIMHIGLGSGADGLDIRRMTLQEITFVGTYTYTMQDFRDTAAAIFDGRLGSLDWPETRSLSEGAEAFQDIAAGRVAAPKIILLPEKN